MNTREHDRDWSVLAALATQRLRRSPTRRGLACCLRYLVMPSFEPWRMYALQLASNGAAGAIGFRSTWNHAKDRNASAAIDDENPIVRLRLRAALEPTIVKEQAQVSLEAAAATASRAAGLVVPTTVSKHSFGVDGCSYELVVGEGFLESQFRWWEEAPPEWRELEKIGIDVASEIERALHAARQ